MRDAPVITLREIQALGATIAARLVELDASVQDIARRAVAGLLVATGLSRTITRRAIENAASATGTSPQDWDLDGAQRRYLDRDPQLPGSATLRSLGPAGKALALELERVTGEHRAQQWRAKLDARPECLELPADEIAAAVAREITAAVDERGAALIRATMGGGKSYGSCRPAAWVALRGGRTILLAPTHAVAAQLVAHLLPLDVRVLTLHSPLAHGATDDARCRVHAGGKAYARTRRSIASDLCDGIGFAAPRKEGVRRLPVVGEHDDPTHDPCSYRDGCEAYQEHRREVDALELEGAGVLVTVHAYAATAHRWLSQRPAGSPGLAVIDEDPAVLEGAVLDLDALEGAVRRWTAKPYPASKRESWRGELLAAAAVCVRDASAVNLSAIDATKRESWRAALSSVNDRTQWTARPSRAIRRGAVRNQADDRALGALEAAYLVTRAALDDTTTHTVGTDWQGQRVLSVGAVDAGLAQVLADDEIARVVLDATGIATWLAPWLPGVKVIDLHAADGAPVERIAIPWSHGTKRHCLHSDSIQWSEIVGPLRAGLSVASEGLARGDRLALFTWLALSTALAGPRETLPPAIRQELDALDARGITIAHGHYGAVRGRDDWQHCAGLLALGTPYPEGRTVEILTAAARAKDSTAHGSARDLGLAQASAELDQVLGRLRAPRRTRPARAVVLAGILPGSADRRWQVRPLPVGAPGKAQPDDLLDRLERGETIAAVARDSGVSERTVQRWKQQRLRQVAPTSSPSTETSAPPAGNPGGGGDNTRCKVPTTGCVTPCGETPRCDRSALPAPSRCPPHTVFREAGHCRAGPG